MEWITGIRCISDQRTDPIFLFCTASTINILICFVQTRPLALWGIVNPRKLSEADAVMKGPLLKKKEGLKHDKPLTFEELSILRNQLKTDERGEFYVQIIHQRAGVFGAAFRWPEATFNRWCLVYVVGAESISYSPQLLGYVTSL